MHGCGWDSGAARERSSALAASVASRYARSRRRWRGRCARPGARGSRVTASRYALGAEGGGAARPGAYMCMHMCPPRNCARCLLGGVGMSKNGRSRVLRAAREARCKACFGLLPRARVGWHTARTLLPPPPPRSSGAPVRWLMARGRRASVVAAAPRSRAAGAPSTRRRRAVGGACACRARSNGRRRTLWWWWWWWQQLRITSGRLPLIGGSMATFSSAGLSAPHLAGRSALTAARFEVLERQPPTMPTPSSAPHAAGGGQQMHSFDFSLMM